MVRSIFSQTKVDRSEKKSKEPSYIQSIYKVLFADLTISFDNVIAVAGAAQQHYYLLIFGLLLSVVLIGTAASYFANIIKNHKARIYVLPIWKCISIKQII